MQDGNVHHDLHTRVASGSISSYVGRCWYAVFNVISFNYLNRLQGLIFLFIAVQFGMYIMIRQLVNAKEWISACMCSLR